MDNQETYQTKLFFNPEALVGSARKRLRTRRYLLTAPLSLIILLMLPISSLAQSALTDDAHVSLFHSAENHGAGNHGAKPNLSVSHKENIYLKFNLSSTLPPATPGSEVRRATLKLYAGSVKTAGKLDVYAVVGEWDESNITANNIPPLGSLVTTTEQIGTDQKGMFIVIDVTPLAQQWLGDDGQGTNGIPNHGLALVAHPVDATTPQMADMTFDSKENSQTSHEAQLNIQLANIGSGLQKVEHDPTLTGDGTTASPLDVASGGINTAHLANEAVTGEKIATNAVTSSELANGAVSAPKITVPLSLTSADPGFTLSIANTGSGAAITAAGAIDTSKQYNIGGQHILSNPGTNNLFAGTESGASNTTGVANAFFGKNSGQANTTGSSNSFVGFNAGAGNTTGGNNSFFGDAAGFRNAAGRDNSFFGFLAGFHNTASNNSYFGSLAGAQNTTGSANAFFGGGSGASNTTGSQNAFFGQAAGFFNTGDSNSFFGFETGANNTTGASNAFFGRTSGHVNTTGDGNAFFGTSAGSRNTIGSANTFVGLNAGLSNTTGGFNTFVGCSASDTNKMGNNLTVLGAFARVSVDNLSHATAIGSGSVVGTSNTVVLGRGEDTVQVPGALNVAGPFGAESLNAATQFNIGGLRVLSIPGIGNLFAGVNSGNAITTGSLNAFFGNSAGGLNSSGEQNSFFGEVAGVFNTAGSFNTFIGRAAGFRNTTGNQNTFFGQVAGLNNTTANQNAFFGTNAGINTTTGGDNLFAGYFAGSNNTTGTSNTVIGAFANVAAGNLSNATAIGAFAVVSASNSLVLGRISENVGIGTTAPRTRLHLANGKIYVEANGQGMILKSPSGACFELTVTDAGALTTTAVTCP